MFWKTPEDVASNNNRLHDKTVSCDYCCLFAVIVVVMWKKRGRRRGRKVKMITSITKTTML